MIVHSIFILLLQSQPASQQEDHMLFSMPSSQDSADIIDGRDLKEVSILSKTQLLEVHWVALAKTR